MPESESDAITLSFSLTRAEVAAAVRFVMLRRRQVSLFVAIGLVLIAVGAIARNYVLLGLGAWFVLFSGFLVTLTPILVARRQKLMRSDQKLTLSDAGVTTELALGRSELAWQYFTDIRVTDKLIFIYNRERRMIIIPVRACASDAQLTAIRALAERRIEAAR
jgi:hypothetical protein